jgi:putative Ig domain-containing protein
VSAAGVLSGTPTDSGSFSFTIGVKDSSGQSGTKIFALTINPGPLTITTTAQLPGGALGQPFSQTLTAAGGTPPYSWTANSLPDGLSLDPTTGVISGAPTAGGSFSFAVTVTDNARATSTARLQLSISMPALPALTITGLSDTANPADQPKIQLALASPYPSTISGQLSLTFTPDAGGGDGTIQFSTGSRIATFTIPAGSTSSTAALGIQAGTVAGTIKITAQNIVAPGQPAPIDVTPIPSPSQTTRIKPAAPSITSAKLVRTANGFSIQVTGYSTARDVTQAVFHFTAAAGSTLQAGDVTVQVQSIFTTWFQDTASTAFGSQFTFTQPFTVQGDPNAAIPGSVTLSNSLGSNAANIVQ